MYVKRMVAIFAAATVLAGLAGCAAADPSGVETSDEQKPLKSGQELAEEVAEQAAPAYEHYDKLWPGADLADVPILYSDTKEAWLITPGEHEKGSLTPSKISKWTDAGIALPEDQTLYYSMEKYQDKPIFVVQVDAQAEARSGNSILSTASSLAVHEIFHFTYQLENFQFDPAFQRYTDYPSALDARVARASMILALRNAIVESEARDDHLSDAAFWWNEWKRVAPEEAENFASLENSEGLAIYTELLSAALRLAGWDADPSELSDQMGDVVTGYYPGAPTESLLVGVSPDFESYPAGGLAALLLDLRGDDWKPIVMSAGSPSPVDLLLANVVPSTDATPDATVQKYIEKTIAEGDADAGKSIDPILKAIQDSSVPIVSMPVETVGSFGASGTYRVDAGASTGKISITTGLAAQLKLAPEIRINDAVVLEDIPLTEVCGKGRWSIPAPNASVTGDTATLDGDFGVSGTATVTTQQVDGRTVYCVTG